jgi:hypothetical protein
VHRAVAERMPPHHVGSPARGPERFAFVRVPNFSMIAFTSALEPLRIANRMADGELYRWQIVSGEGGPVRAPTTAAWSRPTSRLPTSRSGRGVTARLSSCAAVSARSGFTTAGCSPGCAGRCRRRYLVGADRAASCSRSTGSADRIRCGSGRGSRRPQGDRNAGGSRRCSARPFAPYVRSAERTPTPATISAIPAHCAADIGSFRTTRASTTVTAAKLEATTAAMTAPGPCAAANSAR